MPVFVVDFPPRTNIFVPSRSDGRARRERLRDVERDAGGRHDAAPWTPTIWKYGQRGRGQTPVTRADGPSACPGDSSHERASVGASDAPGTLEQAEKSIRVRNAGDDLRPRPGSAQRWAGPTARVPTHTGCPHPKQ